MKITFGLENVDNQQLLYQESLITSIDDIIRIAKYIAETCSFDRDMIEQQLLTLEDLNAFRDFYGQNAS